jgi:hypothetical protein
MTEAMVLNLARQLAEASERERKLREALEWYRDKVADCRKIGTAGEPARNALDADGGKRARAALSLPELTKDDEEERKMRDSYLEYCDAVGGPRPT